MTVDTITSSSSLLLWKHNVNGSGIWPGLYKADKDLFLKDNYEHVFRQLAASLKEKSRASFVSLWHKACNDECEAVASKIASLHHDILLSSIQLVVSKFRGNLGEILVEMLAERGMLGFIDVGTYKPVDPEHEEFIDAEASRNGLPVGIQVKNYSKGNLVKHEVFIKSSAMSDIWLRHDKKVKKEDIPEFLKTPCQYIVSMTEAGAEMFSDWYHDCVVFIGPKKINQLKIQGSAKTGESPKWKMFEEIADLVKKFKI